MKLKEQYDKHTIGIFATFSILVLCIATIMNLKIMYDQQVILEDSVESQLISISLAARDQIDPEQFMSYDTEADMMADLDNYKATRTRLRMLAAEVGAEYIYALKKLEDGRVIFVFDTDIVDEEVFIEYEISEVHKQAFAGRESAGTLNVVDIYGSYNSGAVPISRNGKVVGIVCTDIKDSHIRASRRQAVINTILLVVLLVLVMGLMLYRLSVLMKRLRKMQEKLEYDAHYDTVTGLPNRKYLMEYLGVLTKENPNMPFALMFIDLDNFKTVNDTAGHDAGDELLRHIAEYLGHSSDHAKSFRPAAGPLNIAARVGGDEFIQVAQGISTETEALEVADRLLDGFKHQNFDRYIDKFNVGMSIGIALYPYHTDNFHVLIKYADIAMYHSKNNGKNRSNVYCDEMAGKGEK